MAVVTFKNIETTKAVSLDLDLKLLQSSGREVFIQDTAVLSLLTHIFTLKKKHILVIKK